MASEKAEILEKAAEIVAEQPGFGRKPNPRAVDWADGLVKARRVLLALATLERRRAGEFDRVS